MNESSSQSSLANPWQRRSVPIALLALVAIALHQLLRFVWHTPLSVQQTPVNVMLSKRSAS
jgi:hypothetical protein